MKITKYELVVAPAEKIADEVNSFIEEGWQPFGPPTILPPSLEMEEQVDMVFQPMVRYGNEKPRQMQKQKSLSVSREARV